MRTPGRHRLRPWEEPGHGARGRTRAEPRAGRLHSLWLFVASAPCAVRKIARISLLCHAQVKEFKELFDSLDNDGGGHIDVEELSGGLCNADACCICFARVQSPSPRATTAHAASRTPPRHVFDVLRCACRQSCSTTWGSRSAKTRSRRCSQRWMRTALAKLTSKSFSFSSRNKWRQKARKTPTPRR